MTTYAEYLKGILLQVLDSYKNIQEINDKPGDLNIVKKEHLKINGFLKVITNKIDVDKIPQSDFRSLKSKFRHYLENYSFEQEIETMAQLYSNDIYRVKNMRLKILESLEDKKMMSSVEELIEQL